MPKKKSNPLIPVLDAEITAKTGRVKQTDFEIKKIEWQEKINFQVLRQLENKHEQESIKADTEEVKVDQLKHNYNTQLTLVEIAEINSEIAKIQKVTKELERSEAEDTRYLTERRGELNWFKGLEQLRAISLEIDHLDFDNTNTKRIGEALGVEITNRQFLGRSSLRGFLKGE